ncbi:MAG TPA: hypothetical protein EYG54_03250 [Myxococcales bacterium]|nr:hypothetical protein [Myxococcales bacterium]
MRLFIINLLAAALLAFSVGPASALKVTLGNETGSVDAQVSVTVFIDTEALTGITLLSIGVLFDDTEITFNQAASANVVSYALFGGKGGYLNASSLCGSYPSPGGTYSNSGACSLRVNTTNQVNVDYVSTSLGAGTAATGSWLATTLFFDIIGPPPPGETGYVIDLTVTSPGNTIALAGGDQGTATLVVLPEPGIAGLSLAALLTVTTLRVRGRRKSEEQ